jgi:hypothetical protein
LFLDKKKRERGRVTGKGEEDKRKVSKTERGEKQEKREIEKGYRGKKDKKKKDLLSGEVLYRKWHVKVVKCVGGRLCFVHCM